MEHLITAIDNTTASYLNTLALTTTAGAINSSSSAHDPSSAMIPIGKLREAISTADPDRSRGSVSQLLLKGIGTNVTTESLMMKEAVQQLIAVETFKANLRKGMVKRSPPPVALK